MSQVSSTDDGQPLRPESRRYRPGPRAAVTTLEGLLAIAITLAVVAGVFGGAAYAIMKLLDHFLK
ncbi:hypothetical protein FOE78_13545 [Microlunatus elymi]|uniref:Uncharacterized protein n=1 Tax=Microlunatus elymi TaxID=2596828 RepID=A0A516Q038_9ACTN|nr:hypothetical protein [Microlunatus elymi]QDP96793.1 hypothetical protein FOE78_13545 [Microlunatus elymi]